MTRLMASALSLALWLALPAAHARDRFMDVDHYESAILTATGHPNELNRWYGLWNLDNGRPQQAIEDLRRAAYYGDKLSQHVLSLMYWSGEDVARDPVEAYLWADLAAERGTNNQLLGTREMMWNGLTPEQQEQVRQRGPAYYQRYGDAAAQPRANREIGRFLHARTGTRTGSMAAPLEVRTGRPRIDYKLGGSLLNVSAMHTMPVQDFYGAARTGQAYWNAQNEELDVLIQTGKVKVGPVQKADAKATP